MKHRVLCIDDEVNVLKAFERQLRKQFEVTTADSPEKGLGLLNSSPPFAVVMTDLKMPGMDGIQLLSEVKKVAPNTVRVMLTGHADIQTAVEAVNLGNIFRLLTKPCPPMTLLRAIKSAVEQYSLIQAERELLEKTLSGSVRLLSDMLSLVSPVAFGKASRIRPIMQKLALKLGTEKPWEFEVAAMLSQVGCVSLPCELLEKVYKGRPVQTSDLEMFENHPQIGRKLIENIPRLEQIAEIIAYQEKHYNGKGPPGDDLLGEDLPCGARALHVALYFDSFKAQGFNDQGALLELRKRHRWFDPLILDTLETLLEDEIPYQQRTVTIEEIRPGMVVEQDVKTRTGLLLIAKGQEVGDSTIPRLRNYHKTRGVREPISVLVPIYD